jgi:hypothetical protein
MIRELLETVRQPEYTGENRCPPCTVVNVLLAAALGSLVSRRSKPAGAAVTAVSVGLIYLRGYLVPGTPELTKRYLPPSVLRWFGKEPDPVGAGIDAEPAANGERRSEPTAGDDDGTATVPGVLQQGLQPRRPGVGIPVEEMFAPRPVLYTSIVARRHGSLPRVGPLEP